MQKKPVKVLTLCCDQAPMGFAMDNEMEKKIFLDFLKFQLSPFLSMLGEAADASLLEVFKDRLDGSLSNSV